MTIALKNVHSYRDKKCLLFNKINIIMILSFEDSISRYLDLFISTMECLVVINTTFSYFHLLFTKNSKCKNLNNSTIKGYT